jgi:hypothetical protein
MTDPKRSAPKSVEMPASDQLLEGILEKAVAAARRNVEQFAKLAALARAMERSTSSPAERAKLLYTFEKLANDGRIDAQSDAELFEGLRDGQIMKQEIRRVSDEGGEPLPVGVILAPSNNTKH